MSMAHRPAGQPERPGRRRLTRSRTDRVIAGVCGGFAAYSGIDATIVRLVMVLLAVLGGTGVLLYLIAWVIVPGRGRRADGWQRRAVIDLPWRPAGRVPRQGQNLGCR